MLALSIQGILNAQSEYNWLDPDSISRTLENSIQPPQSFERIALPADSFVCWLRNLPLKPDSSLVHLYDGRLKRNQNAHWAVIDIDVGDENLQQCADAVIRLRTEYLYSKGLYNKIHFNFTSGDTAFFTHWINGYRPQVSRKNQVTWSVNASVDSSYNALRGYLYPVMMYAGSYSLSKELSRVEEISDMRIGDVFIRGGFPGHAVFVVDMAENRETNEKLFLLAQSYMPAQEIHILKSYSDYNPWYPLDFEGYLQTPEYTFSKSELARFKE